MDGKTSKGECYVLAAACQFVLWQAALVSVLFVYHVASTRRNVACLPTQHNAVS